MYVLDRVNRFRDYGHSKFSKMRGRSSVVGHRSSVCRSSIYTLTTDISEKPHIVEGDIIPQRVLSLSHHHKILARALHSQLAASDTGGVDGICGSGQSGTVKNGGVENTGVDNAAPCDRGGQCRSGLIGTVWQGWTMREKKRIQVSLT